MATQLQIRRGTSTQVAAFTGAEGEIVVNTTNDSVHVNDGSTAGGFELARADLNNVSDTDLNAALTGNTVSALTVTALTSSGIDVTGTVTADGGTIVSTGSDAFSSKAVGGYAIQAYQDATSSGHTALDLRSDSTISTRYLIRGYNDAAGTPTEVFSVGADGGAYLNGNVGIGTSSPNYNLTSYKAGANANYLQVANGSTGVNSANGTLFGVDASGNGVVTVQGAFDYITSVAGTEAMRIDSAGQILQGITTIPTGVQSSRQLISSSATGAEIIAYREDNSVASSDFIGAFLIGHDDNSGTEDHFIGMWGEASSANGNMNLKFAAGRDTYETGGSHMMISSGGRVSIGTTSGSYTHAQGLRIVSNEVGSHVLDAAVSIEGSGGDFYPINFTGPSNTGFGALAAFSPSTDYLQWQYRNGSGSTNIIRFDANGNVVVSGSLSKGSGSFRIDHPLPSKAETHHLVHSFIEGPQADNIYRGKIDLVDGTANVNIDTAAGMTEGTYVLLNTNTQCFTSNESGWTAVKGSVSGNTLTITAQDNSCTDTISWMVVGERKDQHMLDTEWTDDNGKVIVEPLKENN